MAQLADQLLTTSEDQISNPVIFLFIMQTFKKKKIKKKWLETAHYKSKDYQVYFTATEIAHHFTQSDSSRLVRFNSKLKLIKIFRLCFEIKCRYENISLG